MFTTTGKQESRVKEEQGVGVWTPTQHLPRMRIFLGLVGRFSQEGPEGPRGISRSIGRSFKCPFQIVTLHQHL